MSGLKFLLDTNFLLGMLKSSPAVIEALEVAAPRASQCAYSAVTRMALLGFPGLSADEETQQHPPEVLGLRPHPKTVCVRHLTACPVASREFHARHRVAQCPGLPRSNSAR